MNDPPSHISSNKLHSFQNLLALSAATLIVTVWSVVSYLAYQNKLLKNQAKTNMPINSITEARLDNENVTNWKTYRNEEYGFEYMYPSDWMDQDLYSNDEIVRIGEYFEGGKPGSSSPLVFYISTLPYEIKFAQDIKNDGTEIINMESVNINGWDYSLETHKQFEVEAANKIIDYIPIKNTKQKDIYLYFSHTSAGCTIIPKELQPECFQKNEDNIAYYRDLRNQILSTLRFYSGL